jgi:hypothetical protein
MEWCKNVREGGRKEGWTEMKSKKYKYCTYVYILEVQYWYLSLWSRGSELKMNTPNKEKQENAHKKQSIYKSNNSNKKITGCIKMK